MAHNILPFFDTPGVTDYAIILDDQGQAWNGAALEPYSIAHWTTYAVAIPVPDAAGRTSLTVPAGLPEGNYNVDLRLQAGGSPAPTDIQAGLGDFCWDGAALVTMLNAVTTGGAGGGAFAILLQVNDNLGAPVAGALVTVRNSAGTTTITGPTATDANGQVRVNLDAGAYQVVVNSTVTFQTLPPQALTVSAPATVTYVLTRVSVASPGAPNLCRVYGWIKDGGGHPVSGVSVVFSLVSTTAVEAAGSFLALPGKVTVTTDTNGYFQADLVQSAALVPHVLPTDTRWRVVCTATKLSELFHVPTQTTADLSTLLPPT